MHHAGAATPMTRISPTDYYQIIHELLPKYVVAQYMLDATFCASLRERIASDHFFADRFQQRVCESICVALWSRPGGFFGMVSTRSRAASTGGDRRRATSPEFFIKTPRRNSLTPRQASITPCQAPNSITEPPPSSTKKSLTWGESPQWNADVSIAEGHYGLPIS